MSLDVWLKVNHIVMHEPKIYIREDGRRREISREEWDRRFPDREPFVVREEAESNVVFHYNITHNLNKMAGEAGLYRALWRPEELDITRAEQLISFLEHGLNALESRPAYYMQFNPANGWGNYEGLLHFVQEYLEACRKWPNARVEVSR